MKKVLASTKGSLYCKEDKNLNKELKIDIKGDINGLYQSEAKKRNSE